MADLVRKLCIIVKQVACSVGTISMAVTQPVFRYKRDSHLLSGMMMFTIQVFLV